MKRSFALLTAVATLGVAVLVLSAYADYNYDRPCFHKPFGNLIAAGDTATLHAGFFENRASHCVAFSHERFQWASSDTSIVSVTQGGLLRANVPGKTNVTITTTWKGSANDPAKGSKVIRVLPPIGSVEIRPSKARIAVGDTAWFDVVVYDTTGTQMQDVPIGVQTTHYPTAYSPVYRGIVGMEAGTTTVITRGLLGRRGRAALTVVDSSATKNENE